MQRSLTLGCAILFLASLTAFAQAPAAAPFLGWQDTYQIDVIPNLSTADGIINLANSGAHMTASNAIRTGYLCANIYVFAGFTDTDPQGEQMQACCTCAVSRNGSANVRARDLVRNPAFNNPAPLSAATIKIVWTVPLGGPNSAATCNARALPGGNLLANAPPAPANYGGFATGGKAWAVKWHSRSGPTDPLPAAFGTETRFSTAPLSANERDLLNNLCGFINDAASGAGICAGCPGRGPAGPTGNSSL